MSGLRPSGYNLFTMKVADLGEFGVIERLTDLIRLRRGQGIDAFDYKLLIGAGDDAAACRGGDVIELVTTDTMVEEVHFTRATTPWRDLGWKVMAANVSDIAAMGGLPLYALVTLGLPPDFDVDDVDKLYAGMLDMTEEYRFSVVGGDMVRSPVVFITIGLTGATDGVLMRRSDAEAGDQVAVTGYLGSSAGGLKIILGELEAERKAVESLGEAHRKPRPDLHQGRILATEGVKAAIDVSDGLVDDLSKLCRASRVSARIQAHQVPVDPTLRRTFPQCYQDLALTGGEDYALIFTAPQETMKRVLSRLPTPATVVGDILDGEPGEVSAVDATGKDVTPAIGGWDHYR